MICHVCNRSTRVDERVPVAARLSMPSSVIVYSHCPSCRLKFLDIETTTAPVVDDRQLALFEREADASARTDTAARDDTHRSTANRRRDTAGGHRRVPR